MKRFTLYCILLFFTSALQAQNTDFYSAKEDSLIDYSQQIISDASLRGRMNADSMFTRVLVRTLLQRHSFNYKFDSLRTLSIIYPIDSSFRIFTWQMMVSENMVRQHGAIQLKTKDGKLDLIPLIDKSDLMVNTGDTVTSSRAWLGAIYYKIIENEYQGEKYYTLLGFDANNFRSDKKIIEVMQLKNGQAIFGGDFFDVPKLPGVKDYQPRRIIIEYKKHASSRVMFNDEEKLILVEHLTSESNEPNKKYTLVPDGDFTGFKWAKGKWVFVDKVMDEVPLDEAPVPEPFTESKVKNDNN